MTDQRIDGAADQLTGKVQNGIGDLTGDSKLQLDGKLNEIKGKAKDAYGKVIDSIDQNVDRVPLQYRDQARKGVQFARDKPLLTTGIVAGAALLLANLLGGRRR